jgi:hypothetical protein
MAYIEINSDGFLGNLATSIQGQTHDERAETFKSALRTIRYAETAISELKRAVATMHLTTDNQAVQPHAKGEKRP